MILSTLYIILTTISYPILLQTIPGGKLITDGISQISNSDSLLINKLLTILLVLLGFSFFCVLKYLIKKHKEELILQNEKNKEENAINVGAQQLIVKGKDEVVTTLKAENEYLKIKVEELSESKSMILKDNSDAFRQLTAKIGQQNDIMVSILSTIQQNHESMKVFILTKGSN